MVRNPVRKVTELELELEEEDEEVEVDEDEEEEGEDGETFSGVEAEVLCVSGVLYS